MSREERCVYCNDRQIAHSSFDHCPTCGELECVNPHECYLISEESIDVMQSYFDTAAKRKTLNKLKVGSYVMCHECNEPCHVDSLGDCPRHKRRIQ